MARQLSSKPFVRHLTSATSFKLVTIVAILLMMLKLAPYFAALGPSLVLTMPAAAQAPDVVPSRFVRVVEFSDAGSIYRVDTESGKVTKTRASDVVPLPPDPAPTPQPTPTPAPTPKPPAPVVVTGNPAWACLFISPAKADAQWLDSDELRAAADSRGIQFRGFRSTESEVDDLGYRKLVRAHEVPCVVIQDAAGKVLVSRKVTGVEDVVKAMDEAKK